MQEELSMTSVFQILLCWTFRSGTGALLSCWLQAARYFFIPRAGTILYYSCLLFPGAQFLRIL